MNPILMDAIPKVQKKCKELGVKRLSVFGSVLSSDFNAQSDIDFLLDFKETLSIEEYTNNYFTLHHFLQNLFNRNVDVITENSLNNPYFIQKINKTKQVVYEA